MNDFKRDDEWQKYQRDTILAPGLYKKYASDGRYVFIDKGRLASIWQKRYAVDTVVQGKDGSAICIEEKIVRWPGRSYTSFCLETHSCTVPGHESPGWMDYGQADYLLYCFRQECPELLCYLVDFAELKEWFWKYEQRFSVFGPLDTLNRTMGRKVPINAVRRNVPTWKFLVTSAGVGNGQENQNPPGLPTQ